MPRRWQLEMEQDENEAAGEFDLLLQDELDNERENPIMVCPVLFETVHRCAIVRVFTMASPPRFVGVSEDGAMVCVDE